MSNITYYYNSDTSLVLQESAKRLNKYFETNNKKPILFLSSGGSSLKLLDSIAEQNMGSHMTVSVLDERFSVDSEINNFAQLAETGFYNKAKKQGCSFIDTRVIDNETQQQLTERFEQGLRSWKQKNPDGLTIVTLGIGPDGHTSGIMPYPEDREFFTHSFENKNWVTGYDAKEKHEHPLRVTTTITFLLNEIDIAVSYVTGANKQDAIRKAVHENRAYAEIPSGVIKEMKHVELLTDFTLE